MRSLIPFRPRRHDTEWIGSRYTLPNKVREGNALMYPEVVMWLELPRGVIVGMKVIDPREPVSFGAVLKETMEHPAEGSPRQPARIRVPNAQLAASLREAIGSDVPVVVAPVPELDAAFTDLTNAMKESEPRSAYQSYLAGGAIATAVVAKLFSAASTLFRAAPWRDVSEEQILRVDIPDLAVDAACLSVIGGAGESFGLLLFRSIDDYKAFATAPPMPASEEDLLAPGETKLLSLSFDRKKDLPPSMRREIERHRWPVAGTKAYPTVLAVDANAVPKQPTEDDYRIMTACATAFSAFFARHRDLFAADDPETICESFTDDDGLTVTLTAPYGTDASFDVEDFFSPDEDALDEISSEGATVHDMDFRLVRAIGRWASSRFGSTWLGRATEDLSHDEPALQLFVPWSAWTAVVDGKRVADSFLEENGERLSDEQRDWFAAQQQAWLSIWEVTSVVPGTIEVRDLLTGESRSVREDRGSHTAVARDALLARVIDFRGISLFGGTHGRLLPPAAALEVIRAVRSKLRAGKKAVAVERLRNPLIGRFMIDRWKDAVEERDARASIPPVLQNTDGDPFLFVTDSYELEHGVRSEVEKRLSEMDGLDDLQTADGESTLVFVRPGNPQHKSWEKTVIGRVVIGPDWLRIETNSERRADALRRRVRDACGSLIRGGVRKMEDPASLPRPPRGAPAPSMSPKERALLRQVKDAHYREWIDTPVPVLGGKTPRAAARSAKGREKLDLLLREMENRENRLPEAERFDVGQIRRELRLKP